MPMDTILVVNAGSSSVKFQIFGLANSGDPQPLIKGQVDGIGTRPRLRAETSNEKSLIDKTYSPQEIADVATAIDAAGDWLRETQKNQTRRRRTSGRPWRPSVRSTSGSKYRGGNPAGEI